MLVKREKGITLIALIVTIVVMLILVAVTLIIALGENGVITNAKRAKEEHEAAAFKEYVEIVAAGNYDPRYDWGLDELQSYGKYNWQAIQNEIGQKYPDATFTYICSGQPAGAMNANNINRIERELEGRVAIIKYLNNNNLSGTLSAADRAQLDKIATDHGFELGTSNKAETISLGSILAITMYGTASSLMVEYKGIVVPIGFINSNMYDYYIIMNKSEAEQLFEFTDIVEMGSDGIYDGQKATTIKRYKGNAENVKIPGTLIDDNGDAILVRGIEPYAFFFPYLKLPTNNIIPGDTSNTYNNTSTMAAFKVDLSREYKYDTTTYATQLAIIDNFTCEHGEDCTDISCKNNLLKPLLFIEAANEGLNIDESNADTYLFFDSEGKMYVGLEINMATGAALPVDKSQFAQKTSKAKSIIVSEGIETIGDAAFANCANLTTIYIPSTIETMGSEIFSDCTSLTEMITMKESIANSSSNYGCPNTINKIYIELTMNVN